MTMNTVLCGVNLGGFAAVNLTIGRWVYNCYMAVAMETPRFGVKIVCVQSWQAIYWHLEVHKAEGLCLSGGSTLLISLSVCVPQRNHNQCGSNNMELWSLVFACFSQIEPAALAHTQKKRGICVSVASENISLSVHANDYQTALQDPTGRQNSQRSVISCHQWQKTNHICRDQPHSQTRPSPIPRPNLASFSGQA